jgi:hypothetical protein
MCWPGQRLQKTSIGQLQNWCATCAHAGLISAAPGKRNSSLQNSARQVEQMVRLKMEQKEYIILCLEDSNDWSNATTRRLVMQVLSCATRRAFGPASPGPPVPCRALLILELPGCWLISSPV